jgi:hypothetical protein
MSQLDDPVLLAAGRLLWHLRAEAVLRRRSDSATCSGLGSWSSITIRTGRRNRECRRVNRMEGSGLTGAPGPSTPELPDRFRPSWNKNVLGNMSGTHFTATWLDRRRATRKRLSDTRPACGEGP